MGLAVSLITKSIRAASYAGFAVGLGLLSCASALAQEEIIEYKQAVTEAVANNPTVKAAWYDFKAAGEEQRVARGNYRPKVDLDVDAGRQWAARPGVSEFGYDHSTATLTITQMLFDGFATSEEVKRLGHEKLARFYEFKAVAENVALEATLAYLDVARQQQLVKLTEENYTEHRRIFTLINERVAANKDASVDLEQAGGRLLLAETNLLTELTSLHDVSARFQRIVGKMPASELFPAMLNDSGIPTERLDLLKTAYKNNPNLLAAVEALYASQAALAARKSSFMPKLDLRLREQNEKNRQGGIGTYRERAVELVVSYNLYNGGSDSATRRQYFARRDSAAESRLNTCLLVRQESLVAYNSIASLDEKIGYLFENQQSISKARVAYKQQFENGDRTLLDLLDTENEYFETRRALVNAEYDLIYAKARTLAVLGQLTSSFNSKTIDNVVNVNDDLGNASSEFMVCPLEYVDAPYVDKDALFDQLMKGSDRYVETDRGLMIELDVTFEHNSSIISEERDLEIARSAEVLKNNPEVKAILEGHTDNTGTEKYNQWLSERRAAAVKFRMIQKYGVNPEQVSSQGFGFNMPKASNDTEEGRAANRRVELILQ